MEDSRSEYYLGNSNRKPIVIQFKTDNVVITQEIRWDAVGEDVMESIYASMIRIGFTPSSVINSMKDFIDTHEID